MTMIPPSIPPAHAPRRTLGELLGLPPAGNDGPDASDGPRRRPKPRPLPLQGVSARVAIVGDCALTELTERYANPHDVPLDVKHTIPLAPGCAVIGVEIRAGGRTVHARCVRKEDAQRTFTEATARGKTAAIVVQVREDVHEISLGNVPPRAEVTVMLRLAERLRVDAGRFEYRLPTTIGPKFVPGKAVGHEGSGWSPDTTLAPDASRLTPPILVVGRIPLHLEVTLAAGATDIQSSLALERTDRPDGMIVLRPAAEAACTGDVVLRFWSRASDAGLRAYTDGQRTLVVIDPPAERRMDLERPREAVYLLDRSGSMSGERITAAKRAIAASLHRLSPTDRLQIIAFGSDMVAFPETPTPATPQAIAAAIAWMQLIPAAGGTFAGPALERATTSPVPGGMVRTVLVVTDGDVANDQQLLQLSRSFDPAVRVFAVGVGDGPSMGLLSRLGRLGGGSHVAIQNDADVEAEIERFDACLQGPIACGLHEAGNDVSTKTDLFAARASTLFVDGARERVRVESVDGRFSGECVVTPSPMPLGALWARDEIERLEDRRLAMPKDAASIDERIAALGLEHQVQTRLTSFVAVDEASQVHGEALEVVQPVATPRDRADIFQANFAAMMAPAPGPMPSPASRGDEGIRCNVAYSRGPSSARPPQSPRDVDQTIPPTPRTHHARTSIPRWYLEPTLQGADECMMMQAVSVGHTPVLELLGDARGAPMRMQAWLDWRNAGMQYLGACFDDEDMRHALAFLERHFRVVTQDSTAPLDVMMALTLLPLLEACRTAQQAGSALPPELVGVDFSRDGALWRHCMASLDPCRSQAIWEVIEQGINNEDLAFLVGAVTWMAAAMHSERMDALEEERGWLGPWRPGRRG